MPIVRFGKGIVVKSASLLHSTYDFSLTSESFSTFRPALKRQIYAFEARSNPVSKFDLNIFTSENSPFFLKKITLPKVEAWER